MSDQVQLENQIKRLVDLRQSGMTWAQVEELMFPNSRYRTTGKGNRDSWNLACKHKDLAAGAFSKQVIGCFGPTQIVVKLRPRVVPMNGPKVEQERITMADLGL